MDQKLREALDIGRDLYKKKQYASAETHLAQVADAKLPYADVYNMLGVIYHDSGQFSRAQKCFEESLRINPSYTEAGLNLSVTYNDMGRYSEAKDLYLQALTSSSRTGSKLDRFVTGKLANMYAEIAEVYLSSGAFDEGIGELRRALLLRPTFIDIRLRLAEALGDAGRVQDALRELRAILAQNPDYIPARIHQGLTLFAAGDSTGAAQELQAVLQQQPNHPRARVYLSMLQEHAQRQKKE